MLKKYNIEVDCANCANKMETAANKIKGVKRVTVNFMTLKMTVDFEEDANIDSVMQEIIKACKKIEKDCEIYL